MSEALECDVLVVGAGPAGLATAIRVKQLAPALSVIVLEKGGEVGAHILSGAVIDPAGLDALLPDWRTAGAPLVTAVASDDFRLTTPAGSIRVPSWLIPRLMSNEGTYVGSLGQLCRWLAQQAEGLGVEIYPGFSAARLLIDDEGRVAGVATTDAGRNRDGSPGPGFQPAVSLHARCTVLAEGARGSLTGAARRRFDLDDGAGPEKYGLGFRELWEVEPSRHRPGHIEHGLGWPLGWRTGGGSFVYHYGAGLVAVGLVVHLDYRDPHLSPFGEFQRLKTHPRIRALLAGGRRLAYGARTISEGGWQSVPRLAFPGGVLVGDAAGFVNVPRIKGSHNAIRSALLAAEHMVPALAAPGPVGVLDGYDRGWRESPLGRDLFPVRNVKPLWSRFGLPGVALGALDLWLQQLTGRSPFGTMPHGASDRETLESAARFAPRHYPAPDGVVTFDRPSSVFLSGTNHREGQPLHLIVRDPALQSASEHDVFAGPSQRYCPAGVYEWIAASDGPRYQVNGQNCLHCKACDILDPNGNIEWTPPEGGDGPNYAGM